MKQNLLSLIPRPIDRILWTALLIVVCFLAVLLLSSQSRASYPTYILALVVLYNCRDWRDVFNVDLTRWIVALLVWLAASAAWSDAAGARDIAAVWIRAVLVFCFVVAFAECQMRGQIQRWMSYALGIFGFVVIVAALVNFFLTQPVDERLNGLGQLDTHVIAALIFGVVALFLLQIFLTTSSLTTKCLLALGLLVCVCAIYLSDSRNAWFSVGFGGLVLVLAKKIQDAKAFLLALVTVMLILSVAMLALVANEGIRDLLLPRGDSYRIDIWTEVISRVWQSNPLIGLGVLADDNVVLDGFVIQHPHNMYLAVFHQGGLIGLALYLVVLLRCLSVLLENYSTADAKIALAIFGLALSAHLLDGHELVDKIGSSWFLIWFPVGISLGLRWRGALGQR